MSRASRPHFKMRFIFIAMLVSWVNDESISSIDRNSDLSAGMTGLEVFVGGGSFSKRIGFSESRCDLPALSQITQHREVFLINVDAKNNKLLLREFRAKRGGEHAKKS